MLAYPLSGCIKGVQKKPVEFLVNSFNVLRLPKEIAELVPELSLHRFDAHRFQPLSVGRVCMRFASSHRAVFNVAKFEAAIYVLHAFRRKRGRLQRKYAVATKRYRTIGGVIPLKTEFALVILM